MLNNCWSYYVICRWCSKKKIDETQRATVSFHEVCFNDAHLCWTSIYFCFMSTTPRYTVPND